MSANAHQVYEIAEKLRSLAKVKFEGKYTPDLKIEDPARYGHIALNPARPEGTHAPAILYAEATPPTIAFKVVAGGFMVIDVYSPAMSYDDQTACKKALLERLETADRGFAGSDPLSTVYFKHSNEKDMQTAIDTIAETLERLP